MTISSNLPRTDAAAAASLSSSVAGASAAEASTKRGTENSTLSSTPAIQHVASDVLTNSNSQSESKKKVAEAAPSEDSPSKKAITALASGVRTGTQTVVEIGAQAGIGAIVLNALHFNPILGSGLAAAAPQLREAAKNAAEAAGDSAGSLVETCAQKSFG